jgi:TonB family protein
MVPPQSAHAASQATPASPVSAEAYVLLWDSGPVSCDTGGVKPSTWIAPHPQFAAKQLLDFPVTIGFSIGQTGRAVDIQALEGGYVERRVKASFDAESRTVRVDARGLMESLAIRDLMPSLRASRFPTGAPQSGCRVVYTPRYGDSAQAGRDLLAAIGAVPGVSLNAARRDQLGGGDCGALGWPASLARAYPDWRSIAAQEGARKWGWFGFDIDEQGVPVNVTVIASSGDAALDAEGLRATRESRFAAGKRTGCAVSWWRDPEIIPAPQQPDPADFAGYRGCEALRGWAQRPRLTFPQAYYQRAIDGWAVLGFDIDAEGAVGNVTVLSAQPSEEFGAAGKAVLQSGRFEAAGKPLTRCITRVSFVADRERAEAATD